MKRKSLPAVINAYGWNGDWELTVEGKKYNAQQPVTKGWAFSPQEYLPIHSVQQQLILFSVPILACDGHSYSSLWYHWVFVWLKYFWTKCKLRSWSFLKFSTTVIIFFQHLLNKVIMLVIKCLCAQSGTRWKHEPGQEQEWWRKVVGEQLWLVHYMQL